MSPANLKLVKPISPQEKRHQNFLWAMMIVGLIATAITFVYKLMEFVLTLGSDEVQGFADVPITVYFIVAAGWLALLVWCFVTGKFHDMERAKFEMMEKEAEYERRGI